MTLDNDLVALAVDPRNGCITNLRNNHHEDGESIWPSNYARFRDREKAIVVAGNKEPTLSKLRLRLPLERLGFAGASSLRLDDLWRGGARTVDDSELADGLEIEGGPDSEPGGDVAVLCIRAG